ncbi:hypothetical protein ACQR0V_12210 [Bradyrhizobium sp. HKCCYLS2058]|uniref:hypothetical protein n=1 Tax=unclassified Bradyrhizobium TaxID=2631580 RepID=UPI003EBADE72
MSDDAPRKEHAVSAQPFPNGNASHALVLYGERALSEIKDIGAYVSLIRSALGRSALATLEAAAIISAARDALDHTGFRQLAKMLGLSAGTLSKFITIYSCRDRFSGIEASLPCAWTVLHEVAKLPEPLFQTLAASGKLRPELSEKEVKRFVAQRAAADGPMSASAELEYLSVMVTFPALLSLQREDEIRRKLFEAVEGEADVTASASERRKLKATRK